MEGNKFNLRNLTRTSPKRGDCIIVSGDGGVGKTTFVVDYLEKNNGVMILGEDGMQKINTNIVRTPLIESWDDYRVILNDLAHDCGEYKAVAIDSLDAMIGKYTQYVVDTFYNGDLEVAKNWGHYYVELNDQFEKMLNAITAILKQGVDVIFVIHSYAGTFKSPDEESYQKWMLKLPSSEKYNLAQDIYNFSDMCLFFKKEVFVDTDSKKATGGNRVIMTSGCPAYMAKTRVKDMPEKLPMMYDAYAKAVGKK